MLLLAIVLASAAILLSGCGGGGGGEVTPPPIECPADPAENGLNCTAITSPSALFVQACSAKFGNVTYFRDNQTCCITSVKCMNPAGVEIQVDVNPSTECVLDSDCRAAGCSSQWCMPAGEEAPSDCMWKPKYACYEKTSCGCSSGTCDWAENAEFRSCMNRFAGGSGCPNFTAPTDDDASACSQLGGENVALPDADGCFVNTTCSADINCTLFSYNCPAGFTCTATTENLEGVCAASRDICQEGTGRTCPEGSRCELLGEYPDAIGVCRKLCDDAASACPSSLQCRMGSCQPIQNAECAASAPCPAGYACLAGACSLAEGRFCNSTTPACPAGYDCDMSKGSGRTGACRGICGGSGGVACPDGKFCNTTVNCRAGETCMGYQGVCVDHDIPETLSKFCYRQYDTLEGNVSSFAKCSASEYFIMRRTSEEFAFFAADGTDVRECGPSAPPNDPECKQMTEDCQSLMPATCDEMEGDRFVHCPPAYSASNHCPTLSEPVCAKIMVGLSAPLRSPEWRTFSNGCLACNENSPNEAAEGYWRGAC